MDTEEILKTRLTRIVEDVDTRLEDYNMDKFARRINGAMQVLQNQKAFEEGRELLQVITEYEEFNDQYDYISSISYGFINIVKPLMNLINNPQRVWDVYDNAENKELLLSSGECEKKKLYEQAVVGCVLNFIFGVDVKKAITIIEKLSEADRKKYTDKIPALIRKDILGAMDKGRKKSLLSSLNSIINMLDHLNGLESNRVIHNEKMTRLGLVDLKIPDGLNPIDESNKLYGVDLESCSVIQIEALLIFYMNRIEKVRGEIDEGVYLISSLIGNKDVYNLSILRRTGSIDNPNEVWHSLMVDYGKKKGTMTTSIDEEKLKKRIRKYHILSKLLDSVTSEEMGELNQRFVMEKNNLQAIEIGEIYNTIFKKYENIYAEVLKEDDANLEKDIEEFMLLRGFSKNNHYANKNELLEELIFMASKEKMNWGIMLEDDNKSILRRYMYIGFDIPGLNMPLRIHTELKRLQEIVSKHFEDDEIPLYIGVEDFFVDRKNFGTQILMPITPKQSDSIKRAAKSKFINSTIEDFVKHLSFIQLPNPIKKLLDLKTKKSQSSRDYIDIKSGDIRRGRRIDKKAEKE